LAAQGGLAEDQEGESLESKGVLGQICLVVGDGRVDPLGIDDSESGLGRFVGAVVAHHDYALWTLCVGTRRQIDNIEAILGQF